MESSGNATTEQDNEKSVTTQRNARMFGKCQTCEHCLIKDYGATLKARCLIDHEEVTGDVRNCNKFVLIELD